MVRIKDGHRIVERETLHDAFFAMEARQRVEPIHLLDEHEREIVLLLDRPSTTEWLIHSTGRARVSVEASLRSLELDGWLERSGAFWFRTQRAGWSVEDYDHAA